MVDGGPTCWSLRQLSTPLPPSVKAAEKLLLAAESNDNYAPIAFLISGLDDFRSLYVALEATQLAAGKTLRSAATSAGSTVPTAKKSDLIKDGADWIDQQGWLTNDQQQLIKDTAHSFEVAGTQARHAPDGTTPPPPTPVPIAQARLQMANLVLKLLKLK
jgi:hypothetical protein